MSGTPQTKPSMASRTLLTVDHMDIFSSSSHAQDTSKKTAKREPDRRLPGMYWFTHAREDALLRLPFLQRHSVLLPERFRIAPFPLRHHGQQPVDSPESRSICGMVLKGHLRVLLLRRAISLFPADFFSYACSLFSHGYYVSAKRPICQRKRGSCFASCFAKQLLSCQNDAASVH